MDATFFQPNFPPFPQFWSRYDETQNFAPPPARRMRRVDRARLDRAFRRRAVLRRRVETGRPLERRAKRPLGRRRRARALPADLRRSRADASRQIRRRFLLPLERATRRRRALRYFEDFGRTPGSEGRPELAALGKNVRPAPLGRVDFRLLRRRRRRRPPQTRANAWRRRGRRYLFRRYQPINVSGILPRAFQSLFGDAKGRQQGSEGRVPLPVLGAGQGRSRTLARRLLAKLLSRRLVPLEGQAAHSRRPRFPRRFVAEPERLPTGSTRAGRQVDATLCDRPSVRRRSILLADLGRRELDRRLRSAR